MGDAVCKYTVVRYLPDPVRAEAQNIGVLVYNRDDHRLFTKFLDKLESKLSFTASAGELDLIRAYVKEFERQQGGVSERFLDDLWQRDFNKIQFTEPKSIMVHSPSSAAEGLF